VLGLTRGGKRGGAGVCV